MQDDVCLSFLAASSVVLSSARIIQSTNAKGVGHLARAANV